MRARFVLASILIAPLALAPVLGVTAAAQTAPEFPLLGEQTITILDSRGMRCVLIERESESGPKVPGSVSCIRFSVPFDRPFEIIAVE